MLPSSWISGTSKVWEIAVGVSPVGAAAVTGGLSANNRQHVEKTNPAQDTKNWPGDVWFLTQPVQAPVNVAMTVSTRSPVPPNVQFMSNALAIPSHSNSAPRCSQISEPAK